jgi:hypothetical protein
MGNCSSTSNCNPCGPNYDAINLLATKTASYARQANTSAVNAENSFLEFNALYLGAFAVAPTVDNEGDPLQVGALYWNTVSNTIFVWNGTVWVENGNFNEFTNFSLPSATPIPAANLHTGQEYEIVVVGNTNWTTIGAPAAQVGVRFTKNAVAATGTGTARVTRDLVTRFADVINVKDFGAVGDGVADDTEAIQAALDATISSPSFKPVYFPAGEYRITDTLLIKSNYTGMACDSFGSAHIRLTNTAPAEAILVRNPAAGQKVFGFSFYNLYLSRPASSTYQIGITLEGCDNTHMAHCEIGGYATSLDIRGGNNCHYDSIRTGAFGSTASVAGTAGIQIGGSSYTSSPTAFSHLFVNSIFGGGASPYVMALRGIDYLTFSNCYFGSAATGSVLVETNSVYDNYDNLFDNCYFDYAKTPFSATQAGITIVDGLSAKATTKINNCRFGPWGIGVKINTTYDPIIAINDSNFGRCRSKAIEINGASTSLVLCGNHFKGIGYGDANPAVIDIIDASDITIVGNAFYWDFSDTTISPVVAGNKKVIEIRSGATISGATITGNAINAYAPPGSTWTDFVNNGTVNCLTITGNASNNSTNTIVGSIIGNQENANPLSLDWYQEGVFTPVLTFGSGSTGITFNDRQGNFTRIGNRVVFDIYIVLTNKGTSTGIVGIGGIPFPLSPSATARANASVSIQRIDGIGTANVDAVFPSTVGMKLVYINGTGDAVDLTDANFRNNTQFWISGTYQVA